MNSAEYIRQLLSQEEYAFSLKEILRETGKGETAVKRELSRIVEKKEIINLRKGFYLIIPPRYSSAQKLPVQLYCEKLFRHLNRKYYLGLYTAAKIHGASHQQVHRDYILIEKPKLNDIKRKNFDIRFFTSSYWPAKNIIAKKSDAGIHHLSSPSLTLADLIHYHTKIGGLNRVLTITEELAEEFEMQDFRNLLGWYPHKSTVQRMGFLLDELGVNNDLSEMIFQNLKSGKFFPVLLSPRSSQKPGATKNRWKIDVNIKL